MSLLSFSFKYECSNESNFRCRINTPKRCLACFRTSKDPSVNILLPSLIINSWKSLDEPMNISDPSWVIILSNSLATAVLTTGDLWFIDPMTHWTARMAVTFSIITSKASLLLSLQFGQIILNQFLFNLCFVIFDFLPNELIRVGGLLH